MAKNNTSTNPTYRGEVARGNQVFSTENHMEHEVHSVLRNKIKNFGYEKATARMFRYDADAGDYVEDAESLNLLHNPRRYDKKNGKAVAPKEVIEPNEAHFDNATKLANIWLKEARSLKNVKARPEIPQDELTALLQDTLQALLDMGIHSSDITNTVGQIEEFDDDDDK